MDDFEDLDERSLPPGVVMYEIDESELDDNDYANL